MTLEATGGFSYLLPATDGAPVAADALRCAPSSPPAPPPAEVGLAAAVKADGVPVVAMGAAVPVVADVAAGSPVPAPPVGAGEPEAAEPEAAEPRL
jgi:hypothetical protein